MKNGRPSNNSRTVLGRSILSMHGEPRPLPDHQRTLRHFPDTSSNFLLVRKAVKPNPFLGKAALQVVLPRRRNDEAKVRQWQNPACFALLQFVSWLGDNNVRCPMPRHEKTDGSDNFRMDGDLPIEKKRDFERSHFLSPTQKNVEFIISTLPIKLC